MASESQGVFKGKKTVFVAVAAVVVAVAAVTLLVVCFSSAEVSGQTVSDRVGDVCRLTDDRPGGAVKALARAAEGDPEPSVRQAAVVGLGRFEGPDARQAVERALADPSSRVRAAAAGTLGLFGDRAAADRLGALAASNATLVERKASVLGLARCDSDRSIVWLLETAEKTADMTVQHAAIRALFRKLGMRYVGSGPSNRVQWLDHVELVKDFAKVKDAYRHAGRTLERHPENLRGHYEPKPGPAPAAVPGGKQP